MPGKDLRHGWAVLQVPGTLRPTGTRLPTRRDPALSQAALRTQSTETRHGTRPVPMVTSFQGAHPLEAAPPTDWDARLDQPTRLTC